MANPSRCPEIRGKAYWLPATNCLRSMLVPFAPAVSWTEPAGSALYCPSFHAATRATEVVAAVAALVSVYMPITAIPVVSRLNP